MADDSASQGGFLSTLSQALAPKPQGPPAPPAIGAQPSSFWPTSEAAPGAQDGTDLSHLARGATNATSGNPSIVQQAIDWLFSGWGGSSDSKSDDAKRAADEAAKKKSEAKYKADEDEKAKRDEKRKGLPAQVKEEADDQYMADMAKFENHELKKKPEDHELTATEIERRGHAKMIDNEYLKKSEAPEKNPQEVVGKLESKEDRLRFLQGFTQTDPSDPKSEHYCGPTVLIAATIHAKGTAGLAPMLEKMATDAKKDSPESAQIADLQKKVADGKLTNADISYMQKTLYSQLMEYQEKNKSYVKSDDKATEELNKTGVSDETMKKYIAENKYLQSAMVFGNSQMSMIDSQGDGKLAHWVLRMRVNDNTAVFDPWARRNGQVVKTADQVDDYRNTTGITFNEFGNITDNKTK